MKPELRKTGISVVGDMPWGTHFCHFYETKQDLLDTLVPYFRAGLENNEFCVWVVSDSDLLSVEAAKAALAQTIPDLDRHLSDGNIEILNGLGWYLDENVFNLERVTSAWDAKLERALALGYAGMRVSGDTLWLAQKNWKDFCAYEKQLNDSITDQPMTLLCTYPLAKCGAVEVFDVVQAHQFAIARRQGAWEVIETPGLIQAQTEIRRLNEQLEQRVIERTDELVAANEALKNEITERRRTEEELRERAADLTEAQRVAKMGNWILDLHTNKVSWSEQLYRIFGIEARDFEGRYESFVSRIHPDDRPRVLRTSAQARIRGLPFDIEYRIIAPNDEVKIIREVGYAAQDETGDIIRLFGTAQDITDRKHAEALLHAKEQEFRAIVENAPDQIIRYDREFRRTYVNPAVLKAYGLPAQSLIGKPVGSVIQDAGLEVKVGELAQLRQLIAAVFETGQLYEYEMSWPAPAGRRYYSVRFFPELDLNGSTVNVLAISRDITERRIAEEALKKEKEVLEKIFDNIPVMIGFVGEDNRVKLVNPEWERTIGWTLKELQEQDVDIFAEAYPDPAYRHQVLEFVTASTGEWVDLKIRVRSGQVIDAACAVVHLSDGTRVAIAQDITERKRAEEHIRATSEQLRALSAKLQSAKEEEDIRIAREIHDEMGSTLTSLRWELDRVGKVISEAEDWSQLQELRPRIGEMIRLTDVTIGTMRRIASELRPSILDDLGLPAALEWQAQQFQARTGIICRCDCSLENIEFNPDQSTAIFRIFQEALTNVLSHAEATMVEVEARSDDGEFVVTISDNGKGITEDEKSNRLSLGILGMQERAHLIGGKLEISGTNGRGTVLTVRIPISDKANH
jgi:PAS domain S-box-containing protein